MQHLATEPVRVAELEEHDALADGQSLAIQRHVSLARLNVAPFSRQDPRLARAGHGLFAVLCLRCDGLGGGRHEGRAEVQDGEEDERAGNEADCEPGADREARRRACKDDMSAWRIVRSAVSCSHLRFDPPHLEPRRHRILPRLSSGCWAPSLLRQSASVR